MLEFIKMFGMGILYTILFPFILAIFAVYLVYAFGSYIVMELINFFGFFFGYTFSEETELEKKLKKMKEESNPAEEKIVREEKIIKEEKVAPKQEIVYQYEGETIVEYDSDEKGSDGQ